MSGVPYTFATATTSIPLSQLDANFATVATLGNASVGLGNTTSVVGNLTLQNVTITSGTSNITTNVASVTGILPQANGGTGTTTGYYGFKNRIINGAMVIDQRNNGSAIPSLAQFSTYTVDRWLYYGDQAGKFSFQQNQGSVTPPTGYGNYIGFTSLSAYSIGSSESFTIQQKIEGFNTFDLAFGSASALTVTLSFWVRSSLTGAFGGSLRNSASNRTYPFSYNINSANTWEQKTITIVGDTSGTWIGATNGIGINLLFSLGAGSTLLGTANTWTGSNYIAPTGSTNVVATNNATFYLTGVQLEVGAQATSFDFRPYGTELALCQRYLPAFSANGVATGFLSIGQCDASSQAFAIIPFQTQTRTQPTGVFVSAASHFNCSQANTAGVAPTSIAIQPSTLNSGAVIISGMSGLVAGSATMFSYVNTSALIYFTGCEL